MTSALKTRQTLEEEEFLVQFIKLREEGLARGVRVAPDLPEWQVRIEGPRKFGDCGCGYPRLLVSEETVYFEADGNYFLDLSWAEMEELCRKHGSRI